MTAAATTPGSLGTAVLDELRGIVGAPHVLTTDGDVEPFARDATPLFRARPDAVVLPSSTAQVATLPPTVETVRLPGSGG